MPYRPLPTGESILNPTPLNRLRWATAQDPLHTMQKRCVYWVISLFAWNLAVQPDRKRKFIKSWMVAHRVAPLNTHGPFQRSSNGSERESTKLVARELLLGGSLRAALQRRGNRTGRNQHRNRSAAQGLYRCGPHRRYF